MIYSLNAPKSLPFQKKIALEYDLSRIIWKDGFFFLENMIFFLSMENEGLSFSRNTWNYDICINDTNLLFSQKNTLKGD